MCGVAGVLGLDNGEDRVRAMLACMQHRGPDGAEQWRHSDLPVVLGHRRLAILDTSKAGTQPMTSRCGRYTLVYNGECYNYRNLRHTLESGGERFESNSDSEVVLAWLVKHGTEGLKDLSGMFALAVWDEEARSVLLARDPFGIKPLYVARPGPGVMAFASEVRALMTGFPSLRCVNKSAIAGYLAYGIIPEPLTILKEVRTLAPGTWLMCAVDGSEAQRGTFAHPMPTPDSIGASPAAIRASFVDAVHRHLVSDVPVGAFLSGGIDSSAIVAAMSKQRGFDVKTLTVSFPDEPEWDESLRARTWAEVCGTDHREVPMSARDILQVLPAALAAQDQPTLDAVNTYVVSAAAAQADLVVVLSGLGGDELFGGYAPTRDVPRALRMRKRLGPMSKVLEAGLKRARNVDAKRHAKRLDLLASPATRLALYLARRRIHSPRQVRRLCPELRSPAALGVLCDDLAHDTAIEDAVSYFEASFYMRNQLLRDSDAMGMAHSIEIRVPFLDHEFARLAWRAGPQWRDRKQRFAAAISDLLPADASRVKKQGFTLPFERWLLGPLRERVNERFHNSPAFLDSTALLSLWDTYKRNPAQTGWTRPWAIYVLLQYLDRHALSVS